ncbi:MAG: hypothetical protein AAGF02_12600 [Actinomycetota bacterium]
MTDTVESPSTAASNAEQESSNPAPLDDTPPRVATWRRALLFVAPALGLTVLFVGWEVYVRAAEVRPLTLPRPSDILIHIWENPGFYVDNARVTLREAFWGFVAAFVAAGLVAVVMAHSRVMERATMPVIVLIQSTPVAERLLEL